MTVDPSIVCKASHCSLRDAHNDIKKLKKKSDIDIAVDIQTWIYLLLSNNISQLIYWSCSTDNVLTTTTLPNLSAESVCQCMSTMDPMSMC